MTPEFQQHCLDLVKDYKMEESAEVRNCLFFELRPWLEKWASSILRRWKINLARSEFVSMTWHGYFFALENYSSIAVPLPSHFYRYMMYFLYSEFVRKTSPTIDFNYDKIGKNYDLKIEFSHIYNGLQDSNKLVMEDLLTRSSSNKRLPGYYRKKRELKKLLMEVYNTAEKRKE